MSKMMTYLCRRYHSWYWTLFDMHLKSQFFFYT